MGLDKKGVLKFAKVGIFLSGALTLASCSFLKSAECSSGDTTDLVTSIVSDKLKEKLGYGGYFGLTKADIDAAISTIDLKLKDIRTMGGEKGAGGFVCEGNLVVNLNNDQIEVAKLPVTDFDPRRNLIGYNDFSRQGFDGEILTIPISYGVQQADDGDRLYAEITNLDNDFINAYVNLALQAVKNAKTKNSPVEAAPVAAVSQEPSPPAAVSSVEPTSGEAEAAPASVAPAEIRPSFNCEKASTNAEKLVCSDAELASLDVSLSDAYKQHLSVSADRAASKKAQVAWIKGLNTACSDVDCMKSEYQSRIDTLTAPAN